MVTVFPNFCLLKIILDTWSFYSSFHAKLILEAGETRVTVQPKNAIIYSWIIFQFTFDNIVGVE